MTPALTKMISQPMKKSIVKSLMTMKIPASRAPVTLAAGRRRSTKTRTTTQTRRSTPTRMKMKAKREKAPLLRSWTMT